MGNTIFLKSPHKIASSTLIYGTLSVPGPTFLPHTPCSAALAKEESIDKVSQSRILPQNFSCAKCILPAPCLTQLSLNLSSFKQPSLIALSSFSWTPPLSMPFLTCH